MLAGLDDLGLVLDETARLNGEAGLQVSFYYFSGGASNSASLITE